MDASFTNPWWWVLFPVLAALAWYLRLPWLKMTGSKVHRRRERRRLLTRLLVILLLVAALTGPGVVKEIQRQAVVLAVDVSASVGSAVATGERWVRDALSVVPPGARAAVIAFGETAAVEEPLREKPSFYNLGTKPGAGATNIGEALRFSRALLPRDARQRVVLLSDGRGTASDEISAARQLHAEGVRVDVVPVGVSPGPDIRLDRLQIPPQARVGENVPVEVEIFAAREVQARIFLERDGQLVASQPVHLRDGKNTFIIAVPAGETGVHRWHCRVVAADPEADVFAANNRAGAVQKVAGPPRVLVLTSSRAEANPLVQALKASSRVEVEVAGPERAPQGVAEWARYQAVFLVNVPAYSLGEQTMQELEIYVRDTGGGLVMVGGPDSYGPGGYAGSPVERALPVKMDIEGRGELPSLGLVLVIDKSGSMGGTGVSKMSLAREAAARSIEMLTKRDRVGVLAFDSSPWWVVPPGPVEDKDKLKRLIGSIQAGGGTEIYPPLAWAYEAVREMPTKVKHIILLTDGMSSGGGNYQELLSRLNAAGITLSTVAVGAGADHGMLKALAELGRGRFYATWDAGNIPAIFTKETLTATRSFAVNEKFYPRQAGSGELLAGLEEVPQLAGYIAVTPKELAQTTLVSPKGDPVLAAWQYGLGRAVAWTPDAGGRWASAWLARKYFPRLWGNVLSWILPPEEGDALHIDAQVVEDGNAGRALEITVDDPGSWQEVRELSAVVSGPGGRGEISLQPSGPGKYKARYPVAEAGAYLIAVKDQGGNLLAQGGAAVPYPREYRETGVDMDNLRAIARAGGGTVLEEPAQAFAGNLPPVRARQDLTVTLLVLACLLWLVDVAGRRLVIGAEEYAALVQRWQAFKMRWQRNTHSESPAWTARALSRVQEARRRGEKEAVSPRESRTLSGDESYPGREPGNTGKNGPKLKADAGDKKEKTERDTVSQLLSAKRRREK